MLHARRKAQLITSTANYQRHVCLKRSTKGSTRCWPGRCPTVFRYFAFDNLPGMGYQSCISHWRGFPCLWTYSRGPPTHHRTSANWLRRCGEFHCHSLDDEVGLTLSDHFLHWSHPLGSRMGQVRGYLWIPTLCAWYHCACSRMANNTNAYRVRPHHPILRLHLPLL